MQTRCPQCQAVHPLEADRPAGDHGAFVCPACGTGFDAYAHLTGATPAVASDDAPPDEDIEEQGELFGARPRTPTAGTPKFARKRIRIPRPLQWRWWLASIALLIVLIAMYPIADRERLARDPAWRPALQRACNTLGCTLTPWHQPSAFVFLARDVGPHPSVKDALLITVTFRNDAAFAQAWPLVELNMSDINGREIAMRRFRPQEYLGNVPKVALISPGQSVSATLEVVNPGRDAVSFSFDFR